MSIFVGKKTASVPRLDAGSIKQKIIATHCDEKSETGHTRSPVTSEYQMISIDGI